MAPPSSISEIVSYPMVGDSQSAPMPADYLHRRQALGVLGGAGIWLLTACASDDDDDADAPDTGTDDSTTQPEPSSDLAPLTAADFEGLGVCELLAEMTEGPFPNRSSLDRRDITEGYPGHPVRLGLRVVDRDCSPRGGVTVLVWHADATGDYSEYEDGGSGKDEADGSTFLRGQQVANDDGIVEFHTIYPGWYPGRAVHIHVQVIDEGNKLLTSQLFFDDGYTAEVFAAAPYLEFGDPETTAEDEGITGDHSSLLSLVRGTTGAGAGTVALLNLGLAE